MSLKSILRPFIPPILIPRHAARAAIEFKGDYKSWAEAERSASGYDAPAILEKVREATQRVVDGTAAYERDSIAFTESKYEMALLACLLQVGIAQDGKLDVVDFGGSLGSAYFQHRKILPTSWHVRWGVVEQAAFVRCGQKYFKSQQLDFYETIDEGLSQRDPGLLLLSGVLQYLPDPYAVLSQALKTRIPFILIEKTLCLEHKERLTVQHVPPHIYSASYPAWFLHEAELRNTMSTAFDAVMEYTTEYSVELDKKTVPLKGMLWKRKGS